MDNSKITTQMRKGILEYVILAIIQKGEAYSTDILRILKENNLLVVEGTLYPLLSRLKTDGLITYFWAESQNGPPRKYYRLTVNGEKTLTVMQLAWQDLAQAIQKITNS